MPLNNLLLFVSTNCLFPFMNHLLRIHRIVNDCHRSPSYVVKIPLAKFLCDTFEIWCSVKISMNLLQVQLEEETVKIIIICQLIRTGFPAI